MASNLHADAVIGPGNLEQQLQAKPLALVFGNEGHGLSEEACAGADGFFLFPWLAFPNRLTSLYPLPCAPTHCVNATLSKTMLGI